MSLEASKILINKKTDNLTAFQKMILDITLNFMSLDEANYKEEIGYLLKRIGFFFKVDRTYLFFVNETEDTVVYSHDWVQTGLKSLLSLNKEISIRNYPWWTEQLNNKRIVQIDDIQSMPIEASKEQEQLAEKDVKSLLAIPLSVDGKTQAFFGMDLTKSAEKWSETTIEQFCIVGHVLSKGIVQLDHLRKIDFISYHDPLTELPNRLLLTKKLGQEIVRANCRNPLISVMFINLDGFKIINENFGYEQGNALLQQVSTRLLGILGEDDIASRTDGDQFILCISDYKNQENLDEIASKIIDAFNTPFILRGEEYNITISMGVSKYQCDGEDVEELIDYAYIAMNKAKCLGKNQYQNCTAQIKEEALEAISLTNDLYKAIERDELLLYYQPQVKGPTGEIIGVEALLRWNHPEHGFVPPYKFIPLAEKTQLILSIGYWVLENAAKQFKKWQEKGYQPIKIAVNFSVYQLNHPHIIGEIKEILERNSLESKYLEIEITESLAMDKNDKIKQALRRMKELGITLSIDDFGKEYSSFNRLKESAMDIIKIDMSFVQGIGVCIEDEGIIRSVLSLAANLGLKTVAEGVETKDQADFLNETACDHLQGYYFHRPMPSYEMEKLLSIK